MSWRKKVGIYRAIVIMCAAICLQGCGVKGDPLPPEKPAELGRGRPNYRRATEGLKIERTRKPVESNTDDDDEDIYEQ